MTSYPATNMVSPMASGGLHGNNTRFTDYYHDKMTINRYVWTYASLPLFVVGVVGNMVTFMVMRRKMFRSTSTGVYMQLMAIADTSFLCVGLLLDWFEWSNIFYFKYLHPWSCSVYRFVFYTTGDTAIWIIVGYTFDRFVAVCFPLHKQAVCQRSRAIAAFGIIACVAMIKNAHCFWTRGEEHYNPDTKALSTLCKAVKEYADYEQYIRPWLAFATVMATPFCLILAFNCLMIRSLIAAQRMRASNTAAAAAASAVTQGGAVIGAQHRSTAKHAHQLATVEKKSTSTPKSSTSYMQTTIMCLCVSFVFLFCLAPSIVLLIGKPYWSPDEAPSDAYDIAKCINNILVYVNHSVNFFLYCLTGQRFRAELVAMFREIGKKDGGAYKGPGTPTGDAGRRTNATGGMTMGVGANGGLSGGTPSLNVPRGGGGLRVGGGPHGVRFKESVMTLDETESSIGCGRENGNGRSRVDDGFKSGRKSPQAADGEDAVGRCPVDDEAEDSVI